MTIPVHTSVIAATNRNLFAVTESGRFREDLYFRVRQFVIFHTRETYEAVARVETDLAHLPRLPLKIDEC